MLSFDWMEIGYLKDQYFCCKIVWKYWKGRKHFFFIWLLVQTPTFLGSEWGIRIYFLSQKMATQQGKNLISHCDIGLFAFWHNQFFSWDIEQSPLFKDQKNDDPTRVKGENKCKSTGWTVKSRPHQIVELQTFLILVLIKWYNSFLILVVFICPSSTFGCEAFIYTYFPLNVLLCLWLPKSFVNADQNSPRIPMPSAYRIVASLNARYWLGNQLLVKRAKNIKDQKSP